MFDPWGAVTVVQDGAGNNLTHLTFFDRGYTGHEHMQSVGLINMNARLYNPTFHRFLEADNFVQDPYNTQNYNRYGYCVNNPLKYTDVTGNVFNIATTLGCIPIVGSIFSNLLMHQDIDIATVAQDIAFTTISVAVTFGIGSACSTIGNFYVRAAVSALAHGVFQGGMTAATGGKFWAGFAAGAVSSIAASFWQGGTNNIENPETGEMESVAGTGMKGIGAGTGAVGTIAFGTIMGGAASSLAGGNFWQGAVSGMIVSGLNHAMHPNNSFDEEAYKNKIDNELDDAYGCPDSQASPTDETLFDMKNRLPTLQKLYPKTGYAEMEARPEYGTDDQGRGFAEAKTFASEADHYKKSYISFYKNAFSSFRNLAYNMLHEFGHAFNNFNLNYYNYRLNHTEVESSHWSERQAFKFAFDYGGIPYKSNSWYLQNK